MFEGAMPSIVVVGAGLGGLGVALELRERGYEDFIILERSDQVGGVWRVNDYPGAGVDTPCALYSFSRAPKTDWPKRFSMQPDILAYVVEVAKTNEILDRIRFGSDVTDAEFDEATGKWTVRTADGFEYTADVLVSAVGQLSNPAYPEIAGMNSFVGEAFHSAAWRHDLDLTGKRVAVIGSGASAGQIVPSIQPKVGHLTLFQRSPAWVIPRLDITYTPLRMKIYKYFPPARLLDRLFFFCLLELGQLALVDVPFLRRAVRLLCSRHLRKQVQDPILRSKLTPEYEVGCKRVVFSNTFLPALAGPNVSVEVAGITEVYPRGVRTVDGKEHEVDVIVYASGFKATDYMCGISIRGSGGRKLEDVWQESSGAHAYLGLMVPHFPNMFLVVGPNTSLSSGSLIYVIESQAAFIGEAVDVLSRNPQHSLDVRADVTRSWDEEVQAKLKRSVLSACTSWYRNDKGRVTSSLPGSVFGYRRRTRRLRDRDFHLVPTAGSFHQ